MMYNNQDIMDVLLKIQNNRYTLTHLDQIVLANEDVDAMQFLEDVRNADLPILNPDNQSYYNYIQVTDVVDICVARLEGEPEVIIWEFKLCPDKLTVMDDGSIIYERGESTVNDVDDDDYTEYLEDEL